MEKYNMVIFLKCFDRQSAEEVVQILMNQGVSAEIQDNTLDTLDKVYFGFSPENAFWIMVAESDEYLAHQTLDNALQQAAEEWVGYHDIYDYSIPNLIEIVNNPSEWGVFEYHLAKRILEDRLIQ